MRSVLVALMMWSSVGAAETLADPLKLPMPTDVKDVCVVLRQTKPAGYSSSVEVASGKDGEIARRGLWIVNPQGKLERQDFLISNTWKDGRLSRTEIAGGSTTTYTYDDRGLPLSIASGDWSVRYQWNVKPAKAAVVDPTRKSLIDHLPRWLPFSGTVEVSVGRTTTKYTYDAHGLLVDSHCKTPTSCSYGSSHVGLQWSGAKLVGLTETPTESPRLRTSYVYGPDNRLTEMTSEESKDGQKWVATGHTVIEYRCKGVYSTDDDVVWPR